MTQVSRRGVLAGGAAVVALSTALPFKAKAQTKPKLRFSCAFAETDLRAEGYKAFAAAMKDDFDFEPYWLNSLFKQGTELTAMQRDQVELVNLAPADISKQIPAWSLMTSAYLFRDADHMLKTFKSDVGKEMYKLARDQLGIELIAPVYFGVRNVNLRTTKKVNTPADLAGTKLRMPPGEYWQFLGESMGVNPTPVPFAELYTALQTGTVDGQDNPLALSRNQKFHEVTKQFVLTGHVVAYDILAVSGKTWKAFKPDTQAKFMAEAEKAFANTTAKYQAQDKEAAEFFKSQGLDVYTPDLNAFRTQAQKKYVEKYGADWPKGMLERINAVK